MKNGECDTNLLNTDLSAHIVAAFCILGNKFDRAPSLHHHIRARASARRRPQIAQRHLATPHLLHHEESGVQ